ncbi:hypothetical protein [Erwinia sp. V71]|uniref:hypothetical protein n=1 Tax=Erwinia sp. V71 TaxID=3369424 RepID=UPI003F5F3689
MFIRHLFLPAIIATALFAAAPVFSKSQRLSDDQVKQQIIDDSIAAYSGNCPCPYNSALNGSRCGKRSAWSRAGGETPICYKDEVSKEMIARWRQARQ